MGKKSKGSSSNDLNMMAMQMGRYGMGGGHINNPMNYMQQMSAAGKGGPSNPFPFGPQPWGNPATNNKARFQPSKSLRDLIADRLRSQLECMDTISERLQELVTLAEQGAANSNGKSPGDEQIDGQTAAGITGQSKKEKDPLKKYTMLNYEIEQLLYRQTEMGNNGMVLHPAIMHNDPKEAERTMEKLMKRVLGPAGGNTPAAPPAPAPVQQVQYQPPPVHYQQPLDPMQQYQQQSDPMYNLPGMQMGPSSQDSQG